MRILVLNLIFCCCTTLYAQQSANIIWGERELVWEDFQGIPETNSPYKAITYSEIKQFLDFDQDTLSINITAEFVHKKSWVVKQTDYLLQHEKLHFDIVEYVARLFRRAFLELHFDSYDDIKPKISALFKDCSSKRKTLQKQYDKDTDHSKIRPQQEKWNTRVDSMLHAHSNFAQSNYSVYIGYLKNPK